MVFEDVHWSDPTTRELLDLLIDRVPTMRALAIITFRPEFTPTWIGRPHVTLMSLNRLSPRQRASYDNWRDWWESVAQGDRRSDH